MRFINEKQPVDRWLNAAIKEYGSVEPDAGLEQRVLRNLQARSARSIAWGKWWVLAATAAIVLIVASVAFKESRNEPKRIAEIRQTPAIVEATKLPEPSPKSGVISKAAKRSVNKAKKQWPAQFPIPEPLNDQEKMLIQYVRERSAEAEQVVEARAKLLQQDRFELDHPKTDVDGAQISAR